MFLRSDFSLPIVKKYSIFDEILINRLTAVLEIYVKMRDESQVLLLVFFFFFSPPPSRNDVFIRVELKRKKEKKNDREKKRAGYQKTSIASFPLEDNFAIIIDIISDSDFVHPFEHRIFAKIF